MRNRRQSMTTRTQAHKHPKHRRRVQFLNQALGVVREFKSNIFEHYVLSADDDAVDDGVNNFLWKITELCVCVHNNKHLTLPCVWYFFLSRVLLLDVQ